MEVLTVIAAALAFAGGEAAKAAIGEGVKEAYHAVKDFLFRKYPQVDLAQSRRRRSQWGSSWYWSRI